METIKNLICEIIKYLENNQLDKGYKEISKYLKNIPLESKNFNELDSNNPPKKNALLKALDTINSPSLISIKETINLSLESLRWNIDNGLYYDKDCDIGNDYLCGNMNTELIGPVNGHFKSKELKLGLFLLEPKIFYKDHKHEAPELYINLTSGTKWRFNDSDWKSKSAGSIIYNEPYKVHAMKVGKEPFLSVWCWPKNSSKKCTLVPKNDWFELE